MKYNLEITNEDREIILSYLNREIKRLNDILGDNQLNSDELQISKISNEINKNINSLNLLIDKLK